MLRVNPIRIVFLAAIVISIFIVAAYAESDTRATNNLPDPFHPIENWAQLPAGMEWGQVIAAMPDAHGNVWVFHRKDPTILEFDGSGRFVKSSFSA